MNKNICRFISVSLLAVSFLSLTGCVTERTNDVYAKFFCDKTTMDEVKTLLGEPNVHNVAGNRASYLYGGTDFHGIVGIGGVFETPNFSYDLCNRSGSTCSFFGGTNYDAIKIVFENGTIHDVDGHRITDNGKQIKCYSTDIDNEIYCEQ